MTTKETILEIEEALRSAEVILENAMDGKSIPLIFANVAMDELKRAFGLLGQLKREI